MKLTKKSNLQITAISLLFMVIAAVATIIACGPGSTTSGSYKTWDGIAHNVNAKNSGTMHATNPLMPCSSTRACSACHGTGGKLNGQTGWNDPSTTTVEVLAPPSCTSCHNIKWSSDPRWNGTTQTCN